MNFMSQPAPWALLIALAVVGCGAPTPPKTADPSKPKWAHQVTVEHGLGMVTVQTCFNSVPPPRWAPQVPEDFDALYDAQWRRDGGELEPLKRLDRALDLSELVLGDCIELSFSAQRLHVRDPIGKAAAPDLAMRPRPLLWGPPVSTTLSLRVPHGTRISTSWRSAGVKGRYQLDSTAYTLPGRLIVGHWAERKVKIGDRVVDIAYLGAQLGVALSDTDRWVGSSAAALSQIFGHFPFEFAQVLIIGTDRQGVAYEALRGGGVGAMIELGYRTSRPALLPDSAVSRALIAAALPRVEQAWFMEGLAIYLAQIARGRANLITELEVWGALHEGLERARAPGADPALRRRWAATAWAMLADVALRQKGDRLERAVRHWRSAGSAQAWQLDALLRLADAKLGAATLGPLRARVLSGDDPQVPNLDGLYAKLGIQVVDSHSVVLTLEARGAAMRKLIGTPKVVVKPRRNGRPSGPVKSYIQRPR